MNDINAFLAMDIPSIGGEFATRTIAPGDVIFLEGQPGDCAYIILKGEVQVATQTDKGEFLTLTTMTAGEMFGEIALLTDEAVRTATTISNEGCELLVVDRLAFEAHLLKVDLMARYILSQFCRRVVRLTDQVRHADSPSS
jgi:CRP-like cAMP-binding protein